MQINLQHSRVATDNLMNLIQQDNTGIVLVQEHTYFKTKQQELQGHTGPTYPPKTRVGQP